MKTPSLSLQTIKESQPDTKAKSTKSNKSDLIFAPCIDKSSQNTTPPKLSFDLKMSVSQNLDKLLDYHHTSRILRDAITEETTFSSPRDIHTEKDHFIDF